MERIDFADLVAKNRRWTWVLLGASFVLLAVVSLTVSAYVGGGWVGAIAGFGMGTPGGGAVCAASGPAMPDKHPTISRANARRAPRVVRGSAANFGSLFKMSS